MKHSVCNYVVTWEFVAIAIYLKLQKNLHLTVWKKYEFTLIIFSRKLREISAFSTKLHYKLISRNIFQMKVKLSNFHTVYYFIVLRTVWKLQKFTPLLFWQKLRENNVIARGNYKKLIYRNIFSVKVIF